MADTLIRVPDIGGDESVEVIEVSVSVGDKIEAEQTLIVLESDKASMEVPAPQAGLVKSISVAVGDKVSEGADILLLEVESEDEAPETSDEPEQAASSDEKADNEAVATEPKAPEEMVRSVEKIVVPDLGGASGVEVIEVNVAVGDSVALDDTLLVLESDKASMEIPSPAAGVIKSLKLTVGDKVNEGDLIAELEVEQATKVLEEPESPEAGGNQQSLDSQQVTPSNEANKSSAIEPIASRSMALKSSGSEVYAGPAVRLMARELGVDLTRVTPTGPKGRIVKEDVQAYVKQALSEPSSGGSIVPDVPAIDFSKFGDVEEKPLSRIQKLTASAMQRSWLNVPHVAHFDEADITDLEEFRAQNKEKAEKKALKLTFLPFLLKACAKALREHPQFNASLSPDGEKLILKQYCHIGIAMDTPAGLMVPVIRDVDKKGIWDLAEELKQLGEKGKAGKLSKADLEGGCFTISSLGAIGGLGFTPIVNTPELAILGVSKTQIKPVYIDETFEPRKMLPLTMSYDHRAINGVDAGQFMTCLTRLLANIRRLVM